jgi:hypothetical protein
MPKRRGDAGRHLEGDARGGERFSFFAAAPEQKRIAALEPRDGEAAAGAVDHHAANFFLRKRVQRFLLAHVDALGVRRRETEQRIGRQVVIEDGVAMFEDATALDGDQFRIAGAGADEIDLSGSHEIAAPRRGLPVHHPGQSCLQRRESSRHFL